MTVPILASSGGSVAVTSLPVGYERRLTLARQSRGKRKKYHRRNSKKQQDVIGRRSQK
jgi:hypothetical protein